MEIKYETSGSFLQPGKFINCGGHLIDLLSPRVMGIVNVTPDSFYEGSRFTGKREVLERVRQIVTEGGTFVDVGAYSSRPGAFHLSAKEEGERLWPLLEAIREQFPEVILSLDTFRSDVARRAVEDFNVNIVNDISGGDLDEGMFETVADLHVPYVLMHMQGTPGDMQSNPQYNDVTGEVIVAMAEKCRRLRMAGVEDIIVDPGFGFGKKMNHNYQLLKDLEQFKLFELPVLVGFSRKSMIYRLLGGDSGSALNGTTVLNTLALTKGANILRVHDVKEAVECVNLVEKLNSVS